MTAHTEAGDVTITKGAPDGLDEILADCESRRKQIDETVEAVRTLREKVAAMERPNTYSVSVQLPNWTKTPDGKDSPAAKQRKTASLPKGRVPELVHSYLLGRGGPATVAQIAGGTGLKVASVSGALYAHPDRFRKATDPTNRNRKVWSARKKTSST